MQTSNLSDFCPKLVRFLDGRSGLFDTLVMTMAMALLLACTPARAFTLPPDFGPPNWQRGPAALLAGPVPGEAVVWLGQVEDFTWRTEGDEVRLVFTCRHAGFARPGPRALDERPIDALPPGPARFRFAVLTRHVSAQQAGELGTSIAAEPHYVLVAGNFERVESSPAGPVIMLATRKFEVHERLLRFLPGA